MVGTWPRTHAHTHVRSLPRTHSCTHVHTHAHTQTRTHARTHSCTHACTHIRMHACTVRMCTCIRAVVQKCIIIYVKLLFARTGLVMQNGAHWKSLKRFTLKGLRNFGLGTTSLEEKIKHEVEIVLSEFDTKKEVAFDPKILFDKAVSNIICSIIFGQRYVNCLDEI